MTLSEVGAIIEGQAKRQQLAWVGHRRLLHAYYSAHTKNSTTEQRLWPLPAIDEVESDISDLDRVIAEMEAEQKQA